MNNVGHLLCVVCVKHLCVTGLCSSQFSISVFGQFSVGGGIGLAFIVP